METDEIVTEPEIEEGQPITGEDDQPESSPEREEKPEQKANSVQKRINELTAKRYEEQRRADELEAKVRELESRKPETTPQVETSTTPKLPEDPYDADAMARYHQEMTAYQVKVAQDAAKKALEETQKAGNEDRQKAERREQVTAYATNALKDGVDLEKLRVAENVLNQEQISPELGSYIMQDPNGGKIAEYLLDNPIDRHEILRMDPVMAGIKIANEIKPKALSTTPKVTGAPEPIRDIEGGGANVKDDFERKYPDTVFI